MSDINELITTTSIKAFNQGVEFGRRTERERILKAAEFVSFEDSHDNRILSIEDLQEELEIRAEEGRK